MAQRLESTCVPQLLGACYWQRLSGTLTLAQPNAAYHVYFEDGSVIYAASEVVAERFGERLCAMGCISPEQLAQAVAETRKGKHLGSCLVDLGYLAAADLQAMLAGHIAYLVQSLFHWTAGEYRFQVQRVKVNGFQQALSPIALIFDGIRNFSDIGLIERWLGSAQRVLQPVSAAEVSLPGLTLTPEEAFVLSRLDAPLSVKDACLAVPLPEDRVLRAICAFTMSGIVKFADGASLPVIETGSKASASARLTPAEIDPARAAELCFELEEKIRVMESGGTHYQVLGINRRFTLEELKKAYRELAKKFHPDRHSQLATFDFQVKAKLERVFIAIQQAYDTLSDEEKRRKYDATLALRASRATPCGNRFPTGAYQAVRLTPSSSPPAPPARPSSGESPSPPAAKSPPMPPKLPPQPLSKGSSPTPPTLKRPAPATDAGLRPAPAPPPLSPPAPPSGGPPRPPTGAHPRLDAAAASSPQAPRMPTGAYPKAPAAAPPETPSIPASELYMKTVEYLGTGDIERAYQAIRRAVEQRPNNADYQALMARVLLRLPGRNKEAEKAFLAAIDLCRDPDEVTELLAELADLYIKFGLESRAIECLDRGLALAPGHSELERRRQSIKMKQPATPRRTSGLRVATGRRLQALVGKVFGLDESQGDDAK
ncbi:MAG: hypothetical protein CFK52_09105 [Chloracidobacterium sp. CP2_5A]|nr:MAG: hypothetical protein CFK52_09105 [Chloracidobacterium sp. CP2_5A]